MQTLSSYFKCMCKNKDLFEYLTGNANGKYIVNMFENMHIKIKPNKKFIQLKEMRDKDSKKDEPKR